jgi:hypothetical protein
MGLLELALATQNWAIAKLLLAHLSPWDLHTLSQRSDIRAYLCKPGAFQELRRLRNNPAEPQETNAWKSWLAIAGATYIMTTRTKMEMEIIMDDEDTLQIVLLRFIEPISSRIRLYIRSNNSRTDYDSQCIRNFLSHVLGLKANVNGKEITSFVYTSDDEDSTMACFGFMYEEFVTEKEIAQLIYRMLDASGEYQRSKKYRSIFTLKNEQQGVFLRKISGNHLGDL